MNFDPLPIILTVGYLAFAIIWVMQFNKRIEPWLRERIGKMLGVRIAYGGGFRRSSWRVLRDVPRSTGCLIAFWEFVVTFMIGGGVVFLGLLVVGLIMFSIYG